MDNNEEMLWCPDPNNRTNIDEFRVRINKKYNLGLDNYAQLYRWSVLEYDLFWMEMWSYCDIIYSQSYSQVIDKKKPMSSIPKWFSGARLNFAENLLRFNDDNIALYAVREGDGCIRTRTFAGLRERVQLYAAALRKLGVKAQDVVAGYITNSCEAVEAMLATASIGAVWSSTSPDFGVSGVLDRFLQIQPKILFTVDSVVYNGKTYNHFEKIAELTKRLVTLEKIIVIPYDDQQTMLDTNIPNCMCLEDFLNFGLDKNGKCPKLTFEQLPFDHPMFIMFSSGTTGIPKCIVHSAGGTLLKHLEEHKLQGNIRRSDIMMYFTTTGWMMWNWTVSVLSLGAAIVLYDGSPLYPHPSALWDVVDKLKITVLGTGAKWLDILENKQIKPRLTHSLTSLHTILSTGSPLAPHSYDYVYRDIKTDVVLGSITGGTDILGCFASVNWAVPVYRGKIQSRVLGMAMECWNEDGKSVFDESGELVCIKPFPSMPTHFLNDAENAKYYAAYFSKYPDVWCHGDFCIISSATGSVAMLGRSDGTLNPNGVRFGSAEIYNIVEQFKEVQDSLCVAQVNNFGEERVVLFLKMDNGCQFTQDLVKQIQVRIRKELSARHIPAFILPTTDIPYTTNGKKVEVAVRRLLSGLPVNNRHALINPESLDLYVNISELKNY